MCAVVFSVQGLALGPSRGPPFMLPDSDTVTYLLDSIFKSGPNSGLSWILRGGDKVCASPPPCPRCPDVYCPQFNFTGLWRDCPAWSPGLLEVAAFLIVVLLSFIAGRASSPRVVEEVRAERPRAISFKKLGTASVIEEFS